MMGILASIGSWLLGHAIKIASGNILDRVVDFLVQSDAGRARLEEIRGQAAEHINAEDQATARARIDALNQRQAQKMNQPVFWVLVAVMMGPPALILWGVAVYNILWWQHGIWPQDWAIADFPPSIKPWVEKSIDWLFDPLGVPTTVGTAAVASWLTGRGR